MNLVSILFIFLLFNFVPEKSRQIQTDSLWKSNIMELRPRFISECVRVCNLCNNINFDALLFDLVNDLRITYLRHIYF